MTTKKKKNNNEKIKLKEFEQVFPARYLPSMDKESGFFRCSYCGYLFEELPASDWRKVFMWEAKISDEKLLQRIMKRSLYIMMGSTFIKHDEKTGEEIRESNPEKVMCGKCAIKTGVRPGGFIAYGYRIKGDFVE